VPLTDILSRHKDLSKTNYSHEILVKGTDIVACRGRVLKFFENYQLVRYSQISIKGNGSISASDPEFSVRLLNAIHKNRQILSAMIKELRRENVFTLEDVEELPQGYKSKLLHIITHFLDGFFGIDTYFFNLEEESHWVSDELQKSMEAAPSAYWLLTIEAGF
jgi:hypothetical protein